MSTELACFISPHGYGHATRTIALLTSLRTVVPALHARLFTTAPESLFARSGLDYSYHRMVTDIGLVQHDAFTEDRSRTIDRLTALLPFPDSLVERCAELCRDCRLVVCDISCLGILTAQAAAIPSVLVENFTWDWIYRNMGPRSGLDTAIDYFSAIYRQADYRIQTVPVCNPLPCDLTCPPMARRPEQRPQQVRAALAGLDRKIVLVSMGGVSLDLPFVGQLRRYPDYLFICAGQKDDGCIGGNVRLLGPDSGLYHPDLISGADLLVCKSGYSTIAECLQTTTPICCVSREGFGESAVLEDFVREEMNGAVIDMQCFYSGAWLTLLDRLVQNRRTAAGVNGADQAAAFIAPLLQRDLNRGRPR